jgi:hypothetical protein
MTMTTKKIIIKRKSKYQEGVSVDAEMIETLAGYGLNIKEIANVLNVTVRQFQYAAKRNRLLREAMDKGKDKAAKTVMEMLYRKATGFERREIETCRHRGNSNAYPVIKYYPPDLSAIVFWLKNRCPGVWKEKIQYNKNGLTEEQLQRLREIAVAEMDKRM